MGPAEWGTQHDIEIMLEIGDYHADSALIPITLREYTYRQLDFPACGADGSVCVLNELLCGFQLILQAAPLDKVPCGEVALGSCIPQRGCGTVCRDCSEQNDTAFVAVDSEFVLRRGIQ